MLCVLGSCHYSKLPVDLALWGSMSINIGVSLLHYNSGVLNRGVVSHHVHWHWSHAAWVLIHHIWIIRLLHIWLSWHHHLLLGHHARLLLVLLVWVHIVFNEINNF